MARLEELKKEANNPDFWKDQERAAVLSQELSSLEDELNWFANIKKELEDLKELVPLMEDYREIEEIEKKIKDKEREAYFSGKYDKGNALLSVFSGAGGQDAQDWAAMLLRMYQRFCEKKD